MSELKESSELRLSFKRGGDSPPMDAEFRISSDGSAVTNVPAVQEMQFDPGSGITPGGENSNPSCPEQAGAGYSH